MRFTFAALLAATATACLIPSTSTAKEGAPDQGETVSLFNGETMEGWDGDSKFWSIKDGAITGITTKDNPTKGNTFCVYKNEIEGDFELTFQYRIEGHNSGVQYRSFVLGDGSDPYRIGGYQADFDAKLQWAGTLYGEQFRGILAKRGEKAVLTTSDKAGKVNRKVEPLGDPAELAKSINAYPEWNQFRVVVRGYHMQHYINDTLMIDCVDDDKENRRNKGLIALQLHAGPPMVVQMKNVKLKKLSK